MRRMFTLAIVASFAVVAPAQAMQEKRPHLSHKTKPKAKLHARSDYDDFRAKQRAAYAAKQEKQRAQAERRLARAGI